MEYIMGKMKLSFLGGAGEVGRMGILFDTGTERFLMDYGVNVENMDVPLDPGTNITALLLSHAHLDHSGHVPSLYHRGWNGRVFATPATFGLCSLLLRDSIKVQKINGLNPSYNMQDINKMESHRVAMKFGHKRMFKTAIVEFNDAGHVPGSSSILIESHGKRVLFTGDIKFSETGLMRPAYSDFENIDVLMIESTYSYKNHPPRQEISSKLKKMIQRTISGGGNVVLPSFAVGRTQEMMLIASEVEAPMYLDGMGIAATRSILENPEGINNSKKLRNAFGRAHKVKSMRQRENALASPSIIITTAGMLNGGPVGNYIKKLYNDDGSSLIMNGFQIPGTAGRTLMDTGRYVFEGLDVKPKMHVDFLDFSAHCGRDEIIKFVEKVSPEKIFLVHGERSEALAQILTGMGFDASVPKNGDTTKVD
jgi:putative mRNA 3-end processing factor